MASSMSAPLDPVDAYNRVAPIFQKLAEERKAYLNAVDRLIIAAIPPGSRSLLDVGAGDGSRARRIARACGISRLVLIEPASAMQRNGDGKILTMRAEDLHRIEGPFDVILCLWNVLGHIFPSTARVEVLRQFGRLLTPEGRAFVDISHRYNARHYGTAATLGRFLRDRLSWREQNGDATVAWEIDGTRCTTRGHVFTHGEMQSLCRSAGLGVEKKFVVDYATGELRRRDRHGHLLYELMSRTTL